jgi:hypothetical protein
MPYSHVGYDLKNSVDESGIGNVNYLYSGSGGVNKAFIGYGLMPFTTRLSKFRSQQTFLPDSLKKLKGFKYRAREMGAKILSDFSVGFNANYIFGNLENTTRVEYPNSSLYNNTYRNRTANIGDFTGNFGLQTAITIDSVTDKKGRLDRIHNQIKAMEELHIYSEAQINKTRDSLNTFAPLARKALSEKVKITFGYFMSLNNPLSISYSSTIYNYLLTSTGSAVIRDTVVYSVDKSGTINLPLEQGFGIVYKKGERVNLVADFAVTNWQNFKFELSTSCA